jgi:hypothetical protein
MTIRILAGGCRFTTATGKVEDICCNDYLEQTVCDLEPCARERVWRLSEQWIKTRHRLPSRTAAVLYLDNSAEEPSATLRYGHYHPRWKTFIEHGSGGTTPHHRVIAWMLIPQVPADIHEQLRSNQAHACLD